MTNKEKAGREIQGNGPDSRIPEGSPGSRAGDSKSLKNKGIFTRPAFMALALAMALLVTSCGHTEEQPETSPGVTETEFSGHAGGFGGKIDTARGYLNDEDYEEAIALFEECKAENPKDPQAYLGIYEAYFAQEEYDKAEEALVEGIEASGDEGLKEARLELLRGMGDLTLAQEDYEEAVKWLKKLAEEDGGEEGTLIDLGKAYLGNEEYALAVETLKSLDTENEDVKAVLLEACLQGGEALMDDGNYDGAIAQLKEAISLDPGCAMAYALLGNSYLESERLDDAREIVEEGEKRFMSADAKVSGDDLDAFLNMASEYYLSVEDMERGLDFWTKAAALKPDNEAYKGELENYKEMAADEAYVKAEELLEAGDTEAASEQYKRAFSLAPDNYYAGLVFAGNSVYCLNGDGSWKTGWYDDESGDRLYFNPQKGRDYAKALTGMQQIDGALYYFSDDGVMLKEDSVPQGYYAGPDGKLTTEDPNAEGEGEETLDETDAEETTEYDDGSGDGEDGQDGGPRDAGNTRDDGQLADGPDKGGSEPDGIGNVIVVPRESETAAQKESARENDAASESGASGENPGYGDNGGNAIIVPADQLGNVNGNNGAGNNAGLEDNEGGPGYGPAEQ